MIYITHAFYKIFHITLRDKKLFEFLLKNKIDGKNELCFYIFIRWLKMIKTVDYFLKKN